MEAKSLNRNAHPNTKRISRAHRVERLREPHHCHECLDRCRHRGALASHFLCIVRLLRARLGSLLPPVAVFRSAIWALSTAIPARPYCVGPHSALGLTRLAYS